MRSGMPMFGALLHRQCLPGGLPGNRIFGIAMHRSATVFCLVAALVPLALAGSARADLASHRAIYTMTLSSSGQGSEIAHLDGKMLLESADACDGWTLDQKIALRVVDSDGTEVRSTTSFTSWEAKDGSRFRFEQETRRNGTTIEILSGHADVTTDEGGAAYLTKPEAMRIDLPPGTVFPSKHTEQLIERAEAGDRLFFAIVFDGSTVDNPNRVSAFISTQREAPSLVDGKKTTLVWPVRLAFFPMDDGSAEPDVEIGLWLQADGVARKVELDYGSFVIHGELDEFEMLAPIAC